MDFADFLLARLPPPPARVLEVGCGKEGGVTPRLLAVGYDVLGIDPRAPTGEHFRPITLEELPEPAEFDAVVASRVFHHVHPLGAAIDKVARLAPLFVLDEFAWERIDGPTQEWYEAQHRMLRAAGRDPSGPPDLEEWRAEWQGLHPSEVVRREAGARFDEQLHEDRPYLYRWLGGLVTQGLEEGLIAAGAIQPVGLRWVGAR